MSASYVTLFGTTSQGNCLVVFALLAAAYNKDKETVIVVEVVVYPAPGTETCCVAGIQSQPVHSVASSLLVYSHVTLTL